MLVLVMVFVALVLWLAPKTWRGVKARLGFGRAPEIVRQ
jgi:hypothetical protein